MLKRRTSGSSASVCRITGRPVALLATSATRKTRAIAASTIERRCKSQHAAVGGDQHEVRRVVFQLARVSLTPRLRLLIFRDRDIEQESEPERGADQGIGKMRSGAGGQDQEADLHQTMLPCLGSKRCRRRFQDAGDFPAEQPKVGLAPTRLRKPLQEFQRLQGIRR
jgi:hypothetical protein